MAWRIRSNSWDTPRGTGGWGCANRQASARMHHPLAQCLQVSTSPVFGPALSATPGSRGLTSRASFAPTITSSSSCSPAPCASSPLNSGSSSCSMATCASSPLLRWSSSSSASVVGGGPAASVILARAVASMACTSTSSPATSG